MIAEVNDADLGLVILHNRVLARLDELEAKVDKLLASSERQEAGLWLTVAEAAQIMRVSRSHLELAIKRGLLPATDVSVGKHRRWRINRENLEQWGQEQALTW